MTIKFLEYKKRKEAQLNLPKYISIISIGFGTVIIVLLKSMDVLLSERMLFIVVCISIAFLFVGAVLQLFVKVECPKCCKNIAFKEGDYCCYCACDFKEELKEVDEFN